MDDEGDKRIGELRFFSLRCMVFTNNALLPSYQTTLPCLPYRF
jgi:hypothetical protein